MQPKKSATDSSRRACRSLLSAGFWALLVLPGALWLVLRGAPFLDTQNYENRTLAAFPQNVSVSLWPAAFESWLDDHAPFRNQLMTLNAGVNRLFGTLDSSDVLLGKEGWLFLKDVSDSKSLSDYQGLTTYSAEETAQLAASLSALQAELEARGSRLTILFAPAKEGVYARYLPDTIPVVRRPTRVQALTEALRQDGISVVWPQQALTDAAETQQVYYKYDTHWNDAGAYLAAQQALAALGLPAAKALPAVTAEQTAAPADLAAMCALWSVCTDDTEYRVEAARAEKTGESADGYCTRYRGNGGESLLLVRDSFGAALAPHLAEGFAEALVLHGNALSETALSGELSGVPDAVVLEVGERFSDNLLRRAEIVLAWVRAQP